MKTSIITLTLAVCSFVSMVHADALDELVPKPRMVARQVEGRRLKVEQGSASVAISVVAGAVPGAPAEVADEAYALEISEKGVVITAPTAKGERYARVTLAQLEKLAEGAFLPCCRIVDWPEYRWRGFMLDTARNYLDVPTLKDVIDTMGRYKLNLFHWHLSENYAWRLESKKYPQLQSEKAFLIRHPGKFYTQQEFKEIVAFAAARGVTIMPELDVPGHALAFRQAFGFDKMTAPGVDRIIAELIDEVCSLASAETMPFFHIGGDEVWKREFEGVAPETLKLWSETVAKNGRTLVRWDPGEAYPVVGPQVTMAWGGYKESPANDRVFEANGMYIETFDPFEFLPVAAFHVGFGWKDFPASRRFGKIFCAWHDGYTGLPYANMVRNQQVFPACVLFGENYWCGCTADRSDRARRLPFPAEPAFAAAVDLERRTIAQRDKVLKDLKHPFHFLKQTDIRWRLSDTNGTVIAAEVAGASVSPFKGRNDPANFVTNGLGCVVMETWIKSPKTQKVGAWIGFTNIDRDHGFKRCVPLPKKGEWTRFGSKIEINGEAIAPPDWKRPGLGLGNVLPQMTAWTLHEIDEEPYTDQEYFLREPTPITLKAGWNHVKLTLPMTERVRGWSSHQWIGTFVPVAGTTDHPHEVEGLVYSAVPPEAKYGFTYFRGNGEKGVYLATSADGFTWTEANGGKPILSPTLGDKITRDPSVCLGPDGMYHMVFTTSWTNQGFGVTHSRDLFSWSEPEFVSVNDDWPEAKNTWAPEICWDADTGCYFVVWATSTTKDPKTRHHRQYCVTTTDFKSWTHRALYYDPGHSVIDAFPFRFKGSWMMVVKDETHEPVAHWLQVARSKGGAFGPWKKEEAPFTDAASYWAEGPTTIELDDGRWVVYFDCYDKKRYGALVTRDFKKFEPAEFTLPAGVRHGTMFRLRRLPDLAACAEMTERAPSAAVRVMRNGREAFVRRAFNATEDIVIHVCRGANEHAYILPKAAATSSAR